MRAADVLDRQAELPVGLVETGCRLLGCEHAARDAALVRDAEDPVAHGLIGFQDFGPSGEHADLARIDRILAATDRLPQGAVVVHEEGLAGTSELVAIAGDMLDRLEPLTFARWLEMLAVAEQGHRRDHGRIPASLDLIRRQEPAARMDDPAARVDHALLDVEIDGRAGDHDTAFPGLIDERSPFGRRGEKIVEDDWLPGLQCLPNTWHEIPHGTAHVVAAEADNAGSRLTKSLCQRGLATGWRTHDQSNECTG